MVLERRVGHFVVIVIVRILKVGFQKLEWFKVQQTKLSHPLWNLNNELH